MSPTALEDEKAPPLNAPGIHTVPILQRDPPNRLKGALLAFLFTLLLGSMHLSYAFVVSPLPMKWSFG